MSWSGNSLIIVCHYVRNNKNFFPIKPRILDRMIGALKRTHNIVTLPDINQKLRRKPICILTFDDGLVDHYEYVLPILLSHGVQGHFYPSTAPLNELVVLDTHIIHILLAELGENHFAQLLDSSYYKWDVQFNLYDFSNKPQFNRWASPLISNIKYSLSILDNRLRRAILLELLEQYVGNEAEISASFYMQPNQLKDLVNNSMHIGCHGHTHRPLSSLGNNEKKREVTESIKILDRLTQNVDSIAYPFGSFDQAAKLIASEQGLSYGLSIKEGALSNNNDPLALPRYDVYSIYQSLGLR